MHQSPWLEAPPVDGWCTKGLWLFNMQASLTSVTVWRVIHSNHIKLSFFSWKYDDHWISTVHRETCGVVLEYRKSTSWAFILLHKDALIHLLFGKFQPLEVLEVSVPCLFPTSNNRIDLNYTIEIWNYTRTRLHRVCLIWGLSLVGDLLHSTTIFLRNLNGAIRVLT